MSERNFDDFDGYAKSYRAVHTANVRLSGADSFYFAEHKVLTVKKTEKNVSQKMLDVGCGDGVAELYFQKHFPLWAISAIDISKESLAEAAAKKIPGVDFNWYNGTDIPFADDSFDVVFVAAVLHHVDFSLHKKILSEIRRVLTPGGRLYVFEHNPYNPVTRHLVNTCPFDKDARLLSASYLIKTLRTISFKNVSAKYTLFFPRKGLLSRLVFLEKKLYWLPLGGQYYCRAVK